MQEIKIQNWCSRSVFTHYVADRSGHGHLNEITTKTNENVFCFNYDSIRIRLLAQGWRETEMSMKPEASPEHFLVITALIHPHRASPCNSSASIFSLLLACGRDRSRYSRCLFSYIFLNAKMKKRRVASLSALLFFVHKPTFFASKRKQFFSIA